MASLKSLTLAALPQIQADPVMDRRNRTIAHLKSKSDCFRTQAARERWRVLTNKEGERQEVEKQPRVYPWWSVLPNGSAVLSVRVAQKSLEFEKGKAGIAAPSVDKLSGVIDMVMAAIRRGEQDEQLALASKGVPSKKKKTA